MQELQLENYPNDDEIDIELEEVNEKRHLKLFKPKNFRKYKSSIKLAKVNLNINELK